MNKDKDKYIKHLEREINTLKKMIEDNDSFLDLATQLYRRDLFETYKESIANLMINDKVKAIPWSILFCDINNLKQVNDTLGHSEADEGIKFIANVIKCQTRSKARVDNLPCDIIIYPFKDENSSLSFRLGGDEFIVILPKCSKEQAKKIAQRIKEKINNSSVEDSKSLSLAIGVIDTLEIKRKVNITDKDNSINFISELMSKADQRMYKDKIKQIKKLSDEVKSEFLIGSLARIAQYYNLDIYKEEDFSKFKKVLNKIQIKKR